MSDTLDLVTEHTDLLLSAGVQTVKNNLAVRKFPPCGTCYYCQEKVKDGQVFCDDDCASDHHAQLQAAVRKHGHHRC